MDSFLLFLPETAVFVAALITLLMAAMDARQRTTYLTAAASATAVLAVSLISLLASGLGEGQPFFPGIYVVDRFSQLLKVGIAVGLFFTILISHNLSSVRERSRIELPFFLFVASAGMMMMVSATELLTFYVALELSAYSLYIMAALHCAQREGSETGAKYILFGAASSAVSLYGISLVFAATQTTYLTEIAAHGLSGGDAPLLMVGVLLLLAGLLFKLGVLPFHAWVPDTYQGAPHQVATFIGTVSKVAAVGVLVRVISIVLADSEYLTDVLVALCVLSMTAGNLAALVQQDIKRLLGYSTIAHAGYILIGLVCSSELGLAAALFYGLIYVPIAFCPFLVVCAVGRRDNPTLASVAGLYRRSPLLAVVLLIGMFGLAGIPPTPGFAGKWFLFSAALERGMFWLVLVGAINATISLYYYLQVVKAAYLPPPGAQGEHTQNGHAEGDHAQADDPVPAGAAYVLAAACALIILAVTGFYPGPLWDLAQAAAAAALPG